MLGSVKDKIMKVIVSQQISAICMEAQRKKKNKNKRNPEDKIFRTVKDRIIKDNKNLFEQGEDYYKLIRVGRFHTNDYMKYESNFDRNKTPSTKEYLDEIKPYLKDSMNNLKKSDA